MDCILIIFVTMINDGMSHVNRGKKTFLDDTEKKLLT
jgi:hypothetical protein